MYYYIVPPLKVFSIVKVAVFLMPTLRKIMTLFRKITVCSSLLPPQINLSNHAITQHNHVQYNILTPVN